MAAPRVFPFRFAPAYRLAGLPFGVTGATTRVEVTDGQLLVRFGPWSLRSPVSNVVATTTTGPFSFLPTAGPAHLSLTDRGLTCATNGERGLCIQFAEPVGGIEPFGLIRHPAVTVTVADCRGLARMLHRTRPRRLRR
ncbi:hypothetical protein DFQ14_102341 [Halopolyspora algeriensis]|uniref:Uncharacterized protein n=1 Tax=Halopolyspora algeriensis TaxID=1500506 RepID=A0A368VW21_9ACTN|nr:hypothetical protein [Halopolyspora algeriensis]RCW46039.1 hypothetical protein DFQ14_102341 [Halopolyspora algeriensis]TQM55451.1 hypothetical protein FHU43_0215 [Halopolyspora algeriensis]